MRLAGLALILLLGTAALARGDKVVEGNVEVSFDGGISPHALPRSKPAPVAVDIDTTFASADGTEPPPQLRKISIAINRGGTVFDRGLPTCRIREIQPTTIAAARRICGGAIVGSGHVQVLVHLSNQEPFLFKGPMLVFNAKPTGGHRRLLAQVYGTRPPSAFVLSFKILAQKGTFGTVIRTSLPKSAWKWAFVKHFDMRLRRTYTYKGKRHSYVSAACRAPAGFPGAVYPFAQATFAFAEGQRATLTLIRDCKVR